MNDRPAAGLSIDGFRGTSIAPDSPDYDEARAVFNGMIDRRPTIIARCGEVGDVVAVVNFARENELPLSVYGGGHGVTGSAVVDAGVCLDMRGMRDVVVDVDAATARVGGGATWGEVDAATQEHGLAVTGGRVSTTGVAGLALGSGSGWLERAFGLVCDNLLEAQVVTADGRVVVASETENPELFWGLRGGGGNFGVVTEFVFRLHRLGPVVFGGMLLFPSDRAAELVRFYRDFTAGAPDEVGSGLAFITAPPEDFVPEPVRGQPVIGIVCCYAGPVEDGEEAFRPLRGLPYVGVDLLEPMPYVALQQLLDPPNPKGMQNYWTADFFSELPDEAIDTLVSLATKPVSPLTQLILIPGGGAFARVDEEAMAFGQRGAPFNMHYLSMWPDPADTELNVAYTRELAASMRPWTTGRAYLNFIGDEGTGRVEAAFGPSKYARLAELKRVWDPTNLFRHNQNIAPAPSATDLTST
ncbi:MAG TPA: FAD-binding oxidoreductase [Acidimicrobiales bacterium]|nr:FAD-binding oxidoreductase [Acidimicrobiales bacterium]